MDRTRADRTPRVSNMSWYADIAAVGNSTHMHMLQAIAIVTQAPQLRSWVPSKLGTGSDHGQGCRVFDAAKQVHQMLLQMSWLKLQRAAVI